MYHLTSAASRSPTCGCPARPSSRSSPARSPTGTTRRITHDYGAQLPSQPIIPVVRSDGSGATYFFTRWMANEFPSEWNAFCQKVDARRVKLRAAQTEFYPRFGDAKLENGSDGGRVHHLEHGEGAIGYDEYAYALKRTAGGADAQPGRVLHAADRLERGGRAHPAQINENPSDPDFLQQNLDNVYNYTDPRSLPALQLQLPDRAAEPGRSIPPTFNTAKGATLSHVHRLLALRRAADRRRPRLLAAADEPGPGGAPPGRPIPGARRRTEPAHAGGLQQPDLHQRRPHLARGRAVPQQVRQLAAPLDCTVGDGTPTAPARPRPQPRRERQSTGSDRRRGTGHAAPGRNGTGTGTGGAGGGTAAPADRHRPVGGRPCPATAPTASCSP